MSRLAARPLLDFARAAADSPHGFAWLDANGRPDPTYGVHTWITTRMTHVFALAHLLGEPGAEELAGHGVRALRGPLRDAGHGGWFSAVTSVGEPVAGPKEAYAHAFVVLAGSSATAAGIEGGEALLAEGLETVERWFLDEDGRAVDAWDRAFTTQDPYRGANASMHLVEALLAAGDVTGDPVWHRRALAIVEHLVHEVAAPRGHLLPEHFTTDWQPLPDYNADDPADPFRPFGVTPGHLLEWSRLLLHLEASLSDPPAWLELDARSLFAVAVDHAWAADGAEGFVYTLDWERRPVVRSRMHWVHAEAYAAAAALHRRTGEAVYEQWRSVVEDFCAAHLVDGERGSWHHELDADNRPAATTWHGKPDVYHAWQALLLAERPLAPCLAAQLAV